MKSGTVCIISKGSIETIAKILNKTYLKHPQEVSSNVGDIVSLLCPVTASWILKHTILVENSGVVFQSQNNSWLASLKCKRQMSTFDNTFVYDLYDICRIINVRMHLKCSVTSLLFWRLQGSHVSIGLIDTGGSSMIIAIFGDSTCTEHTMALL